MTNHARPRPRLARGCDGEQALLHEHRRLPQARGLLPRVGDGQQVAIRPRARRELQTERQTARVEAGRNDHRRDADHVDPARRRMRPFADAAILRHGLVGRRHLDRRIDVAIELQAIERLEVRRQHRAPWRVVVALGVRIGVERRVARCGRRPDSESSPPRRSTRRRAARPRPSDSPRRSGTPAGPNVARKRFVPSCM